MAQDNKETEIKIEITADRDEFEKKVLALNPVVSEEVLERTIRFDTPTEDLRQKGIFVRVRSGFKNVWTVKQKIEGVADADKYRQRNEWEIEIEDLEKARQMLKTLGFDKELIMEKYRKKFTLPKAEIVIDRLPFGTYAEIEAEKDEIERLTELLGIDPTRTTVLTYWHLHDDYNKANGLTDENIVF